MSRIEKLWVSELFHSLQGETSLSGLRFAFIRLTGCNLRCSYCDSAYAFKNGRPMAISEILDTIRPYEVQHVLLTGGEPLLQRPVGALIEALEKAKYQISIETHGEIPIHGAAQRCRIIMDIKTPSSGMNRNGFVKNLPLLKPTDEVKFVIASQEDLHWATDWVLSGKIPTREILFSPAVPAAGMPGIFQGVQPRIIADWIVERKLPVRLQTQLHKWVWGANVRGV